MICSTTEVRHKTSYTEAIVFGAPPTDRDGTVLPPTESLIAITLYTLDALTGIYPEPKGAHLLRFMRLYRHPERLFYSDNWLQPLSTCCSSQHSHILYDVTWSTLFDFSYVNLSFFFKLTNFWQLFCQSVLTFLIHSFTIYLQVRFYSEYFTILIPQRDRGSTEELSMERAMECAVVCVVYVPCMCRVSWTVNYPYFGVLYIGLYTTPFCDCQNIMESYINLHTILNLIYNIKFDIFNY